MGTRRSTTEDGRRRGPFRLAKKVIFYRTSRVLFGFTSIFYQGECCALVVVIYTTGECPYEMFLHILPPTSLSLFLYLFFLPAPTVANRGIYPPANLHDRRVSGCASLTNLVIDALAFFSFFTGTRDATEEEGGREFNRYKAAESFLRRAGMVSAEFPYTCDKIQQRSTEMEFKHFYSARHYRAPANKYSVVFLK